MLLLTLMLAATTPTPKNAVSFDAVLSDLMGAAVSELSALDPEKVSPLAVGGVSVSNNLASALENSIATRFSALVGANAKLKQAYCAECFALTTRLENGEWVASRGLVDKAALRRVGESLAVRAFVLLTVEWRPAVASEPENLSLEMTVVQANSGAVLLAKRFSSDDTGLAREQKSPEETLQQRREELERLIRGEPVYGHNLVASYWRIPVSQHNKFDSGNAISLGYRIYDAFGPKRAFLYGVQLQVFMDPSLLGIKVTAVGGAISALVGYTLSFSNTAIPRLRFAAQGGAFIAGVLGNTFFAGGIFEVITRLGLSLSLGLQYLGQVVTDTSGPAAAGISAEPTPENKLIRLGGLGVSVGASWVFE